MSIPTSLIVIQLFKVKIQRFQLVSKIFWEHPFKKFCPSITHLKFSHNQKIKRSHEFVGNSKSSKVFIQTNLIVIRLLEIKILYLLINIFFKKIPLVLPSIHYQGCLQKWEEIRSLLRKIKQLTSCKVRLYKL